MKFILITVFQLALACMVTYATPQVNYLIFKTKAGHIVKVKNGNIFYDNRKILDAKGADDVIYNSRSNRLIEDHGIAVLLLAEDGRPNLDRLKAYIITPVKVILKADAILSDVKDFDKDGYLEFGGKDLTEMYPNRDSMYYIPTAYYEIRNGNIKLDKSLTRAEDVKINGVYISPDHQLNSNGNCCLVIPDPKKAGKRKLNM